MLRRTARRQEGSQRREAAAEPGFAGREPSPVREARECGREELNLHGLSAHRVLNPTRLPVPPRPRNPRIALSEPSSRSGSFAQGVGLAREA